MRTIILLIIVLLKAHLSLKSQVVPIKIKLNGPTDNFNTSVAVLKYNKEFAYSFTMDDGKIDAYTNVFPLLKGGVADDGNTYSGFHYTDGCGNKIPFSAGIAWTSQNRNFQDGHSGNNPEVMTWEQLKEVYDNGWDIFNHSLNHMVGDGTDYNFQVSENIRYVKQKIGVELKHFVVPSGDTLYVQPAFKNGMVAVYNQQAFPGGDGLLIDKNINLNNFKLERKFLNTKLNDQNVSDRLKSVADKSNAINHYWYSEFTHHVVPNASESGMYFSTFLSHMNYIENAYGSKGKDNIWVAPLQDVYEYLQVMKNIEISQKTSGSEIILELDFKNVPDDLGKYAISLIVDTDQEFTLVPDKTKATYNSSGTQKLINLEWTSFPQTVVAAGLSNEPIKNEEPIVIYNNEQNSLLFKNLREDFKKISLYNINGQIVLEKEISEDETLNLQNISKGVYQAVLSDIDSPKILNKKIILY